MSVRKPHNDLVGYLTERRNKYSGGHTVIYDCKLAEKQGYPLVQDYVEEGGRYQIACDSHGYIIHSETIEAARYCMMDATNFCQVCRCISGEAGPNWERDGGLRDEEIAMVWQRRAPFTKEDTL